jgi:hypothetical protein
MLYSPEEIAEWFEYSWQSGELDMRLLFVLSFVVQGNEGDKDYLLTALQLFAHQIQNPSSTHPPTPELEVTAEVMP